MINLGLSFILFIVFICLPIAFAMVLLKCLDVDYSKGEISDMAELYI